MSEAFLLSRVRFEFDSDNEDLIAQLSAIAITPDGYLWVGSDEFLTVERLAPTVDHAIYGEHQAFHLEDVVPLADDDTEIDIEGLDYADGYLWVVGSHSAKRKKADATDVTEKLSLKAMRKDIKRLAKIKEEDNRYLLARIPVKDGKLVKDVAAPKGKGAKQDTLSAACLRKTPDYNLLMSELKKDKHLGPFLEVGLPSKDNGFDIEGLAVLGHQIFLGLRGPVLGGWAIILEIELEENQSKNGSGSELGLKKLDKEDHYRKHFVNLNGLGIRDLCLHQGDLILLAGPTMLLPGIMQVFRLKDVLAHRQDTLWPQSPDALELLFDLPYNPKCDNAEGLAIFPCLGYDDSLMVVYDAPDPKRRPDKKSIFADVFRLPQ